MNFQRKFSIFLYLVLFIAAYNNAFAWDVVDATTVRTYHSFTEPSQNTDNSPLTDLDHINVYFSKDAATQLIKLPRTIPALSPNGGGTQTGIAVEVPIAVGEKVTARFALSAVSTSGLESALTPEATLLIDRPVPNPNAPTGFTLK